MHGFGLGALSTDGGSARHLARRERGCSNAHLRALLTERSFIDLRRMDDLAVLEADRVPNQQPMSKPGRL